MLLPRSLIRKFFLANRTNPILAVVGPSFFRVHSSMALCTYDLYVLWGIVFRVVVDVVALKGLRRTTEAAFFPVKIEQSLRPLPSSV